MKPFVKTLAASSLLVLSLSSTPALAAKIGVTMSAFDDNFLTVLRNGIGQRVFKRGRLGKRNIVAGYKLLLILIHG